MLKYLVADGRFDYIETRSLLSIRQNIKDIVIPSEEESLELNPFDFEEFLWAMGETNLANLIKTSFAMMKPLPDNLHRKALSLFQEYMLVGGMPEPLRIYADQRKFEPVDRAKKRIIDLYRNDVSRFAQGYEFKVVSILDGIPGQLSKHEKRFTLSSISKNNLAAAVTPMAISCSSTRNPASKKEKNKWKSISSSCAPSPMPLENPECPPSR